MPTPDQIRAKRASLRMTQAQAASVIGKAQRTWQQYELGRRSMNPDDWTAFTSKAKRNGAHLGVRVKRKKIVTLSDIEAQCKKIKECWIWQGLLNPAGYPVASYQGKPVLIHRLTYRFSHTREIDASVAVIRKCENPKCLNPEHLDLKLRK